MRSEPKAPASWSFNTAMSGYQEVLTDPSYKGQIVTFTYPHIGNYGVNEEDVESNAVQAAGLVVHELSRMVSNYRAATSLQDYLEKNGVAGIEGVDTRAIVRVLRSEGAMRCVIAHGENLDHGALVEKARGIDSMNGLDLTPLVTTDKLYTWSEEAESSREWYTYTNWQPESAPERRYKVVAMDFGIKRKHPATSDGVWLRCDRSAVQHVRCRHSGDESRRCNS